MKQAYNLKNKDLQININGTLYHRDVAGISPFDSAVQGGDAVWEGASPLPRQNIQADTPSRSLARIGKSHGIRRDTNS